jgi:hypothetical protein
MTILIVRLVITSQQLNFTRKFILIIECCPQQVLSFPYASLMFPSIFLLSCNSGHCVHCFALLRNASGHLRSTFQDIHKPSGQLSLSPSHFYTGIFVVCSVCTPLGQTYLSIHLLLTRELSKISLQRVYFPKRTSSDLVPISSVVLFTIVSKNAVVSFG